jgi:hypothetical protein
MLRRNKTVLASAILLGLYSGGEVYAADSITSAVKEGSYKLSFRARYEYVDVADKDTAEKEAIDDANAVTLKTRLTAITAPYHGFKVGLEFDDVTAIVDRYNTPAEPSNADKETVLDPEGTEVNQAYLEYGIGETTMKYGRQRILLDNQRFVGGVGFRQNEQTYDGFTVTNKSLPDTTLFYGFVNNVNRIVGESLAGGDHDNRTHLLNAGYSGLSFGKFSTYAYLIDNDDAAKFSSKTFGVRFSGSTDVGSVGLLYTAEYATQSDFAENPEDYDADYFVLEGGVKAAGVTAKLGYESLEGDKNKADAFFRTPLATLHKFQGWTDKFLGGGMGNIGAGIDDLYFSVGGSVAGVKLMGVYHDYETNDGGIDLGSEYGFVVAKAFDNYGVNLKYSDFSEGDDKAPVKNLDTSKLWLTLTASY